MALFREGLAQCIPQAVNVQVNRAVGGSIGRQI
jgi:hypothetical protein